MNKKKIINITIVSSALLITSVLSFIIARVTADKTKPQQFVAHTEKANKDITWTCSMHPQIKLKDKVPCPICGMELIPLKKGERLGARELRLNDYAVKLAEIQVQPVEKRNIYMNVHMLGKINFDETRIKVVSARFGGRLDRLFVDYTGVPVKKDDHLFEIYSPELITAQEELLQAIESAREMQKSEIDVVRQSSEQAIEASRDKLRLWGLKQAQIKAIEKSGKIFEHISKYSPMAGIVIKKHLKEGAYVEEGTAVYTIADLTRLWVELDAYESDLPWLHFAQEVSFETESFPGEVFTGKISFIHPVLNSKTRTVKIRVNVDNTDGRLKPGMFVRSKVKVKVGNDGQMIDSSLAGKWISPMHPEVISDKAGQCTVCGMDLVPAEELGFTKSSSMETPLVVPASAVLITGRRAVVYIKSQKPGIYEGRVVRLGSRAGDNYIVKKGLKEGELVVVNGNFKIDSALQILAKPSMMSHVSKKLIKKFDTPLSFRQELQVIYDAYLAMGTDLSLDKYAKLKDYRNSLENGLKTIDTRILKTDVQEIWVVKAHQLLLKVKFLSNSNSLKQARKRFKTVSDLIIPLIKQFGSATDIRLAYCSMAFNNSGGYWLQKDDKVANPYFGSGMYRCGDIRKVFTAKLKTEEQGAAKVDSSEESLLQNYLQIQQALSKDKLPTALIVTQLGQHLKKLTHKHKFITQKLINDTTHLHRKSLKQARVSFKDISSVMISLAETAAFKTQVRKAFCPMAFDDIGAAWLQTNDKIENPYYGSKMFRCGSVKKIYNGGQK